MTTELEKAYHATAYRVFLPAGALELRIDVPSPELVAWLAEEGVDQWAILTAANPGSRLLTAAENAERQARLEIMLLEEGFEAYAGENVADGGDWPTEETCFVPGIPRAMAVALARQFGQNAILSGEAEGRPRLVWIEETNE